MIRIDMRELGGGAVLAGALHGKQVFAALLEETGPELSGPEPLFLDFQNVHVATASFLRESVLAFRDHIRGHRTAYYPVIANVNEELSDELLELTRNRGDALMMCTISDDNQVSDVALIGDLNPKQKITFELVQKHGETDAAKLMREYGELEGTTQTTAWNNRLSALAAMGLIAEISQGRNRRYRPLFAGE